jgi:hypothetical protein
MWIAGRSGDGKKQYRRRMEKRLTHEQLVGAYEALTGEGRVPTHEKLVKVWLVLPNEIDTRDNTRYEYTGKLSNRGIQGWAGR